MCGIAGLLVPRGADKAPDEATLRRMADAIAHRGPDGAGVWIEDGVGLAHRRLAIIDLSERAAQPMVSPSGRFVIVFNGEIYNYRELRAPLVEAGVRFRSASDTEVLLALLDRDGIGALGALNGMFAFAAWDRRERVLHLARDRFGVKPLYYRHGPGGVAFGSEIKAILAAGAPCVMDAEALREYLTFQNFFTRRTLFKDIHLLPNGTRLEISADGTMRETRYWDFDFREPAVKMDETEAAELLDVLLDRAVERQLVSDVPIGSWLSGGMDSGAISCLAAKRTERLTSFTVGFDLRSASGLELAFDERPAAEHMSYLFGTEHYEMVLKAGDMERCMPALAHHLEEPRVGQSYPNFYAAKLGGRFVKVVLSGTGGDELFGGYPWRYYRAMGGASFDEYIDRYYSFWQRLLPDSRMAGILAPLGARGDGFSAKKVFRDVFGARVDDPASPEAHIKNSLQFEAKTFLQGLLVVEDKLSMAHGLESRVPFLDNDLVDFAMSLPCALLLSNLQAAVPVNENLPGDKPAAYFAATSDGKRLLRRVMSRYVPAEIYDRKKQGFSAPDASWYRGESIDYVRRALMGKDALVFDLLDRTIVHELVDDHISGRENRRLLIWSLLSLEAWLKRFSPSGVA
jgi:asparagine synthase (glutamine-hydrolysing)